MKICTSEKEYINEIAPAVQRACKAYGYLPSVLIGQSCLENGYGIRSYWDNPQIEALLNANNMVGIKSELLNSSWSEYTVWEGKSLTKQTPEEYNGKQVTITDNFRIYDTIERSFCDFLLFIKYASNDEKGGTPKYGDAVLSIKDPKTLITTVAKKGYATGSTYPTNVMKIINKHNLTKYDDLSQVEPSSYATNKGGKSVSNIIKLASRSIKDITSANKSQVPASRGSNPIKFIVIHYLGVPNADNPYLYGGGYGGHYNIQRNGEIYLAANPKTAVVWQCGGGLQGSEGHTFYKICTNYNSIGIECGVAANTTSKDLSGDSGLWYFTEETQESLVWLVSKLMDDYNIPFDHVIRHFDVTGKICPNPYVKNNNYKTSWTWDQFKSNLKQYRKDGTITIPNGNTPAPTPSSDSDNSSSSTVVNLKKGSKGDAVKTLQTMLNAIGYNCGTVDGDFGNKTLTALKAFQTDYKLSVDGIYGPKSRNALEKAYNKATNPSLTKGQKSFLDAIKNVADMARTNKWTYGNSTSKKPCEDKKISCDRLIARALYDLGYTGQPTGGITCGHMDQYLPKFGFTKVTKKADIKPGAIIAVQQTTHSYIDHVFVVKSYNSVTDMCDKYDTGSDQRIQSIQPFTNVKLNEWSNRRFVCAWNVPDNIGQKTNYTYLGIDYSLVFDPIYYSNKYADLKKAFGTDKQKLFNHFCTYGMKECRQAISTFNVNIYKNNYKDLQKAFGNDMPKYYKHYIEFGYKEKRKAI